MSEAGAAMSARVTGDGSDTAEAKGACPAQDGPRGAGSSGSGSSRDGVAFLLSQLGSHSASRFAERLRDLDLTPPQAGILRLIAAEPGLSQQELSGRLGLFPSRMVAFIDDLAARGLVTRTRRSADRRVYALALTEVGRHTLRQVSEIASAHEREIGSPLTADERATLIRLCQRVAEHHGLVTHVHPGYRSV